MEKASKKAPVKKAPVKKTGKKLLTPENKKRLLTNAGKAIGKFMKLKKVSVPILAKKTGLKIADINDFTKGKQTPTKTQLRSMYKALDVPKEVVLLYSIESKDVAPRKRKLFNEITPLVKGLAEDVLKKTDKKSKRKAN